MFLRRCNSDAAMIQKTDVIRRTVSTEALMEGDATHRENSRKERNKMRPAQKAENQTTSNRPKGKMQQISDDVT